MQKEDFPSGVYSMKKQETQQNDNSPRFRLEPLFRPLGRLVERRIGHPALQHPHRAAERRNGAPPEELSFHVRLLHAPGADSRRGGNLAFRIYLSGRLLSFLLAEFRTRRAGSNARRRRAQRHGHGLVHSGALGRRRSGTHSSFPRPERSVVSTPGIPLPGGEPDSERKNPGRDHGFRRSA